ncbi:MAG: chemotaxis protein CheA [Deltaproteobacteria bacterium RIFOXYD12_FULL_50_9]|nr:MAG: chemotaxis protein CheA [Deltaproteobacteria bacterium RIFOXYD12_FULL_50_9]
MAKADLALPDFLDNMALKILMVEPGDLSVVGELLELVEQMLTSPVIKAFPGLVKTGRLFVIVLQKMIMGELPDDNENYERLGQCISLMQDVVRTEGRGDEKIFEQAVGVFAQTGLVIDPEFLDADQSDEGGDSQKPASASLQTDESESGGEVAAGSPGALQFEGLPDFLKDRDLLGGFIDEAFEHLEGIEVNILELEQNPDDLEIINNIFRPFHTIKGVSGFLNLKVINKLAHTTENLLDDVRNNRRKMDSDVIDIVLSVGDQLRVMVQNIRDILEKGMDHYIEFDISEYVEQIRNIQEGKKTAGSLRRRAAGPSTVAELKAQPTPFDTPGETEPDKNTGALRPTGREDAPASTKSAVGASIKVDIEKLDGLVNAVGELVIMQAMVRQNPMIIGLYDPKLNRDFAQLSRITTELQRTAMSMRMVPIRQTFQKMIRLVRDLSKKSGKVVDLIMTGEETEIDRNMVDSIYDPLVHMIRNSIDHGVQVPAEREKIGKPAVGVVNLRAYQKGGHIMIEIEDDGQGLNSEKIRKKAIERGLIQEGDALSDHELNNLIFIPGFSTADKITDVSGRGVGMDVVKKGVEKLRGKVEVLSQSGKGSQFIIRLPLTLAIIDGIIVRVGSERYIIPTIAIKESMRPKREFYNTVHGRGEALLIRETLIPIIRLYELFGVESTYTDPCEAIVVVVESEGRQRALMVDELLGKQEVVIKSLGGYMKEIPGVAGGTILGDGRVGLILDLAGIIGSSNTVRVEEERVVRNA